MPIYEYQCDGCGHAVEVLLRRPDEQPECPDCGGTKLEKQMSVFAAQSSNGSSKQLPVTGGGEACGMPRCCGGGCQM